MSLKNFMILNSVSFAILGLMQGLIPDLVHPMWGISFPDKATLFMSHRWGILSFCLSIIIWLSRNQSAEVARPLLTGVGLGAALTGLTSAISISNGLINGPMAWFAVSFEFVLAIGFAWFLIKKPIVKPAL